MLFAAAEPPRAAVVAALERAALALKDEPLGVPDEAVRAQEEASLAAAIDGLCRAAGGAWSPGIARVVGLTPASRTLAWVSARGAPDRLLFVRCATTRDADLQVRYSLEVGLGGDEGVLLRLLRHCVDRPEVEGVLLRPADGAWVGPADRVLAAVLAVVPVFVERLL